jgi:acetyltransferase-like isoleucine patch superfamily enzyme
MHVTRSKLPSIGSVKLATRHSAHIRAHVRDRIVREVNAFGPNTAIPERLDEQPHRAPRVENAGRPKDANDFIGDRGEERKPVMTALVWDGAQRGVIAPKVCLAIRFRSVNGALIDGASGGVFDIGHEFRLSRVRTALQRARRVRARDLAGKSHCEGKQRGGLSLMPALDERQRIKNQLQQLLGLRLVTIEILPRKAKELAVVPVRIAEEPRVEATPVIRDLLFLGESHREKRRPSKHSLALELEQAANGNVRKLHIGDDPRYDAGGRFASLFRIADAIAPNVIVGEGTAIMAYASIGASTVIGRHVQIMPLASIDGECVIGDFATICPSSTIYGRVVIEDGVFVGVGARIVNDSDGILTVGAGAMISAGAVVTHSVCAGQKLAGNPAQELRSLAAGRRT